MRDWICGFFMAWGMFLAIPCPRKIWSESARQKMLVCIPLVGLLAGGVWAGAWLLLRCTLMAIVLTVFLASGIERLWGIPANEALAPIALIIGALGNGWRPVFEAMGEVIKALVERYGSKQ